jgi:NAD(P)-dependent dehydrogenase (short-subunit alcohol dehydrogenase family)
MATAVVTGAASGIGRALAVALGGTGQIVHLVDVQPVDVLAHEVGGQGWQVDVSNGAEVQRLAAAVGPVQLLCLNAGITGPTMGPPWEASTEEWQQVLGVNLMGVVHGLRAFLPAMVEAAGPASVLITGSLAGLVSFPGGGAYAASKHAVVAVAEQASLWLRDSQVSVTLACPALVRTGMSEVGEDPADVAAAALAGVQERRFLVMPEEWRDSLRIRARRLATGRLPELPAPAAG